MQAIATHLRRKNLKMLEEQLSLPKIPEKGPMPPPQTSARSRKPRSELKYFSETALSPEEEHLQDQIRMILCKDSPKGGSQQPRTLQLPFPNHPKREKSLLPRLKQGAETPKIDAKSRKLSLNAAPIRQAHSQSSKFDLSSILNNQSGFIENYFAQLSAKVKK